MLSILLLPTNLCVKIDKNDEFILVRSNRSWDSLDTHKNECGFGFKCISTFSNAILPNRLETTVMYGEV